MNDIRHVHFQKGMKDKVYNFLENYSNDIVINVVEENKIGITIEREDVDQFLQKLEEDLEKELVQ